MYFHSVCGVSSITSFFSFISSILTFVSASVFPTFSLSFASSFSSKFMISFSLSIYSPVLILAAMSFAVLGSSLISSCNI